MKHVLFMRPPQPHGGPGSFQSYLQDYLLKKGCKISYYGDHCDNGYDVICVFSSTKHLFWLIKEKIKGRRVVLRLDGMNLKHRFVRTGLVSWLYSELDTMISLFIANFIADSIIFQSKYIQSQWGSCMFGKLNQHVIYNGVDCQLFVPKLTYKEKYKSDISLVCVEGTVEFGGAALKILNSIVNYRVYVYGKVSDAFKKAVKNSNIFFMGVVHRSEIPGILVKYSLFLLLETNPPCPNSVIEAQACGLPIVAYESGSISELVSPLSVPVMPYGSDPEKYQEPNTDDLESVIASAHRNIAYFSDVTRVHAVSNFDFSIIGSSYHDVLFME